MIRLPSLDEGVPNPPVVDEAADPDPSSGSAATPSLATLPTWGERRHTGRGATGTGRAG